MPYSYFQFSIDISQTVLADPDNLLNKRREVVVVVVVYFILNRLLYLAFSANLGLLCMPHPGMGPIV